MNANLVSRVSAVVSEHLDLAVSLIVVTLVLVLLCVFAILQATARRYRDPELAGRHELAIVGAWPGHFFSWLTRPFLWTLRAIGLGPSAVTLMSLHLAVGAAAAIAANRLTLGGWLFVLSGTCDFLDGKLARATNTAGPSGAVLDSVVDRYVDAIIWIGVAWLYREHWMLIAVLFAQLGTFAVPYVRARVEALRAAIANVGWFQRPERVALLAFGLIASSISDMFWKPPDGWPPSPLLAGAVLIIALASHVSALQRLLFAQSVLAGKGASAVRVPSKAPASERARA